MSTFRQLLNDVVMESSVTLDPLEAGEFDSPPRTSLYDRIKRWINVSYTELLADKPEWFYTNRTAVVTIMPRLRLAGLSPTSLLQPVFVGDKLKCQVSEVEFTVVSIDDGITSDNEGYAITADVEFDDEEDVNNVLLNEKFDRISPAPVVDIGRIGGRGSYNFRKDVPTLDDFLEGSVEIQEAVDFTDDPSTTDLRGVFPVNILPWSRWSSTYSVYGASAGRPIAVAISATGDIEFYPRPEKRYDVRFAYSQKGVEMVNEDDEPFMLPEKYHPYIKWRTLMELGDFNTDPKLFQRAKKHADKYMFWMARDLLPKPSLDLERFDYPTWSDARVNGS